MDAVLAGVGGRLDRRAGHLYRQIADRIREKISSGVLGPGVSLPTQRELGVRWGIGEVTIRRALRTLADEGLLEARPGRGTVVCSPSPASRPAGAGAATHIGRAEGTSGGGRAEGTSGGGRAEGTSGGGRAEGTSGGAGETSGGGGLTLGVAFADLAEGYPFFPPILAGLRDGPRRVALRLFDWPDTELAEGRLESAAPLTGLDGLIMMSPVNLRLLNLCQRQGLATVLLFSDLADGFSHCIVPDYAGGVSGVVGHLARAGRTRIALVTAGADRFSTGRWVDAYRAAHLAYGLPLFPGGVVHAGYAERQGAQATGDLLARPTRPDAILYASDFMARGGLLAAHGAGVRVPEDLAIVGAGPILGEGGWTVPLTGIDLGLGAMGRLARQTIEAVIQNPTGPPHRQTVPAQVHPGQTAPFMTTEDG